MLTPSADLSPEALYALADYLDDLARTVREEAYRREYDHKEAQRHRQNADAAHAQFMDAGQIVGSYIARGMTTAHAITAARQATGLSREALESAWSHYQRTGRFHRGIVIDYLQSIGWKDAEIAQVVGLHPVSISRDRAKRRS